MTKIESLTPEQEAQIPVYRERWIKIGLSCEPCDKSAARPHLNQAYVDAGLSPPPFILVMGGPISGAMAAVLLDDQDAQSEIFQEVGARLEDQLDGDDLKKAKKIMEQFRNALKK